MKILCYNGDATNEETKVGQKKAKKVVILLNSPECVQVYEVLCKLWMPRW